MERIMEDIFQNPQQLFKVSQAGLEYVNKWHDPVFVAGITKSVYES
jgi:hypothetical protein